MSVEQLFHLDHIFLDVAVDSRDEVLTLLAENLQEGGFVKASYVNAILQRENEYPTGLPTDGLKVAIPHADVDHVIESCISIAKLRKPVVFKEMGDKSKDVAIDMVFMLALNDKSRHINTLPQVIGLFSQRPVLQGLKQANTKDQILDVLLQAVRANAK